MDYVYTVERVQTLFFRLDPLAMSVVPPEGVPQRKPMGCIPSLAVVSAL